MKKLSPRGIGLLVGLGAVAAAVGLPLVINSAEAANFAGQLTVVLPAGGSPVEGGGRTAFTVRFPAGSVAACTGDSATGGYRVQSFMIPASENPAALTFDASGPLPQETGSTYRQPLWQPTSGGVPYVDQLTGLASQAGGPGPLPTPPNFSFSVWSTAGAATIPEGTYTIGIACTLGEASATQLDKYWTASLVITHDPGDQTGLHWSDGSSPPPTTTTTSTTTTTTSTTTTTTSTTTTTIPPTTTTTTTPSTTTTTIPSTTTTTTPSTTTTTIPPTTTTTPPTTTTTTPSTTTTTIPPTTTTTTHPPTTTTTIPPTTTTHPPTTTTTIPPTTTTHPPTTTTTVPNPPRPPDVFDVTCAGGSFRHSTEGTLRVIRTVWWFPKLAIFTPDGKRPMLGLIKDIDVYAVGDKAIDRGHAGNARGFSVCISEPYQTPRGQTVVAKFKVRFG